MYKLSSEYIVIRMNDNAHIPCDINNRDWIEYQEWLNAGNVPLETDPNQFTHMINES